MTKTPEFIKKNRKNVKKLYSSPSYAYRVGSKIDYEKQSKLIMVAQSSTTTDFFIRGHAFSILGIFDVKVKGLGDPDFPKFEMLTLFYLYNPWGTDIPDNMRENPKDIFKKKDLLGKANSIKIDDINDGKTFVEYSDILRYFEKINLYEIFENYEVVSKKIDFFDVETSFEVNFTLNSNYGSNCFLFFNLLNDVMLSPQTQPYQIESLEVFPPLKNTTFYLDPKSKNNMLYKGVSFQAGIKSNYSLKFKLKKFHYDITDHFYLSFYIPENSLQINNIDISKKNEVCPENCNQNGVCNNFNGSCACFPKVIFLMFKQK